MQTLAKELTALEGQRGGSFSYLLDRASHLVSCLLVTQQYDFANKVPKTPQESSKPAAVAPAAATATATGGKEAEGKDKKDKKNKGPKEGR